MSHHCQYPNDYEVRCFNMLTPDKWCSVVRKHQLGGEEARKRMTYEAYLYQPQQSSCNAVSLSIINASSTLYRESPTDNVPAAKVILCCRYSENQPMYGLK